MSEKKIIVFITLAFFHKNTPFLQIKWNTFGGLNVLALGDLCQLPPVKEHFVFRPLSAEDSYGALGCMTPSNLWTQFSFISSLATCIPDIERQVLSGQVHAYGTMSWSSRCASLTQPFDACSTTCESGGQPKKTFSSSLNARGRLAS